MAMGKKPRDRPVITRTRSWRGLMQVRHDDSFFDYSFMVKQLLVWSPLRITLSLAMTAGTAYAYLGHDGFMYHLFGYESEAAMEYKPMNRPSFGLGELMLSDRKIGSGIRDLEVDKYEEPKFNVFVPPEQAEATTVKL